MPFPGKISTTKHILRYDKLWQKQYEQLVEFKRTNGHCMVTQKYEQDKSLGQWVTTQRVYHKNNKLRLDRKKILDAIGFAWEHDGAHTWNLNDKHWQKQYEQLVDFKRINGHCMVPSKYEQDKSLGKWVSNQRATQNKLRLDRRDILDKIGFAWKDDGAQKLNQNDKLWQKQYAQLLEFKRTNGHCMVTQKYEQDKSLGEWVHGQRKNHTKNKLRLDRKRILDAIGFAWEYDGAHTLNQNDKLWQKQYVHLVKFKQKKGHCVVPYKYEQDKSLGMWVSHQRSFHNNNKLRLDRKELLDQIGFAWNARARAVNCSSLEKDGISLAQDGGRDAEESKPSLVTSSELILGSDPGQDVAQEEAAPDQVPSEIPSGWTPVKLEPDC